MLITTQFQQERALRRDVHQAGLANAATFARSQKLSPANDNSAPTERLSVNFRDPAPAQLSDAQDSSNSKGAGSANSSSSSTGSANSSGSGNAADATSTAAIEQNSVARMRAEQQAAMMAESAKTSEAIRKIYDEMWAELRKSEAQRFQLLMETSRAVSELISQSFQSTLASSEAHNKAFLAAIIDAPKD